MHVDLLVGDDQAVAGFDRAERVLAAGGPCESSSTLRSLLTYVWTKPLALGGGVAPQSASIS